MQQPTNKQESQRPKTPNDWELINGKGIWQNYKNSTTGEETVTNITPRKISSWDKCDHFWILIDPEGNIQCERCGLGKRIVWGIEVIKKGKIVKVEE